MSLLWSQLVELFNLAAKSPSNTVDPLTTDGNGNLNVVIQGGGGGGTASVDETPFVAGSSSGTPIMAEDPTSGELLVLQTSPGTRSLSVAGTLAVTPLTSSTASAAAQTTLGTSAATLLAANAARVGMIIQNTGTTRIFLTLGTGTPTATVHHVELPACGTANDGSSPAWYGPPGLLWLGAIKGISSANGGTLVVTELT